MKTNQEVKIKKIPVLVMDPVLERLRDKNLFPEKLENANKMLKTAKLPKNKHSN